MRIGRHRAFTLIELLVVISIVVMLIAILLPSVQRATEVSRRAVCASNQHQVAAGFLNYAADAFGQLPMAIDGRNAPISKATQRKIDKGKLDWAGDYRTVPFMVDAVMWRTLRDGYGLRARAFYCPSLWQGSDTMITPYPVPSETRIDSQNPNFVSASDDAWPDAYQFGLIELQRLRNVMGDAATGGTMKDRTTAPANVLTSPVTVRDRGEMHLLADRNNIWMLPPFFRTVSHVTTGNGTVLPEGCNRTYLDGHVEWIGRLRMGFENTPLNPTTDWRWSGAERYNHWTDGDRRYYW